MLQEATTTRKIILIQTLSRNFVDCYLYNLYWLTSGEGLNYMREEKEGFQYLSQGTLLAGIGITETIVGIFTFRGKGVGIEI
jgi:hypothetical protein